MSAETETIEIKDVRGRLCRIDISYIVMALIKACIKRNQEIVNEARAEVLLAESMLEKFNTAQTQISAVAQCDLPEETKNKISEIIIREARMSSSPEKKIPAENSILDVLSRIFAAYRISKTSGQLTCLNGDGI